MDAEIVFSRPGGIGRVLLNRPRALNALTLDMCHALERQLRDWVKDDGVHAVVLCGAGERAFCAGGDIRHLYEAGKAGEDYPYRFWADEYRLNVLIGDWPKPYISLIDGIVMGGGVGLSVHGRYRVVSEHALFAMPETGIGMFPDVGGSHFLPRCPGNIGLYLGLTGARLKAPDLVYAGIATHYVPRARLDALEAALAAGGADVADLLAGFAQDPRPAPLAEHREAIDRLFAGASIEDILAALEADGSDFARGTARTLATKSPTALKLAFRQISEGARLSLADCMRMEWRMASRVPTELIDFYEGVRAVVLDKDNKPRWSPAQLADVDPAVIERFFAPSPRGELELY